MLKTIAVLGIVAGALTSEAAAQNSERKYEVGIRSALVMGTMELSKLDRSFGDLEPDGPTGPHMSGFFFLYKIRPNVRIGIETLVANSDQSAATSMNYQAAGPVVGVSFGEKWVIGGGVHGGGLIVNAMTRQGALPAKGASSGTFYKGNGGFLSPYVDLGRRIGRHQVGMFVKPVMVFGEADRGGLSAFSSSFMGVRYTFGL
jgi:hypothetical protein